MCRLWDFNGLLLLSLLLLSLSRLYACRFSDRCELLGIAMTSSVCLSLRILSLSRPRCFLHLMCVVCWSSLSSLSLPLNLVVAVVVMVRCHSYLPLILRLFSLRGVLILPYIRPVSLHDHLLTCVLCVSSLLFRYCLVAEIGAWRNPDLAELFRIYAR